MPAEPAGAWQNQQSQPTSEGYGPNGSNDSGWGPEANLGPSPCVPASALSGMASSDELHAIIRFGKNRYYRLRLSKACPALLEEGAHVVSATRGPALICEPDDVELKVVSRDGSISRCPIYDMNRMHTAEAAAAPAHH
jgi:hypothetical protein